MLEETLKHLETWYREPSEGGLRPKLLSKMAIMELCGWLECEFDRMVLTSQSVCLKDEVWARSSVTDGNSGFTYSSHLRPMLTKVLGEVSVRGVEFKLEQDHPGELDGLKSLLGSLWKQRCSFAHADLQSNVQSQQTFYAPSWSIAQYNRLKKSITRYDEALMAVSRAL